MEKRSADRHLTIINLFQQATPYEKSTSSDRHLTMKRKIIKKVFLQFKKMKKERKTWEQTGCNIIVWSHVSLRN